jgi:hypothetical protein
VLMRCLKDRPPASDLFGIKGRRWLAEQRLPLAERETVDSTLRVDLVFRARARPHELRPAREAAAHHPDPFVRRPHAVELARPQQLGERAGVEPAGLGAHLADTGVARRHDNHARNVRLDDPRDLPRIAGHLKRDPVTRIEALREELERLRARRDPPARTQPAVGDDRHLAEVAVDIQRYRSLLSLRTVDRRRRRTGGQTTSTDPRSQRNRASRRGGHRKARAQGPSSKTACPACVLPKAPSPSQPKLGRPPDVTDAFGAQFHAPTSRNARQHWRFSTKAALRRGAGAPGGALSEWTQCSDGMTSETAS